MKSKLDSRRRQNKKDPQNTNVSGEKHVNLIRLRERPRDREKLKVVGGVNTAGTHAYLRNRSYGLANPYPMVQTKSEGTTGERGKRD